LLETLAAPSRDSRSLPTVEVAVAHRVLPTALASLCAALAAFGVLAAPAFVPGGIAVGILAGCIASCVGGFGPPDRASGKGPRIFANTRHPGFLVGTGAFAVALVVTGFVVLLGAASGPIILVLLLGAAAIRLRRYTHRPMPVDVVRSPASARVDAPAELVPADLPLQELSRQWRRSHGALLATSSGPARAEILDLRELLLTELERRDPDGFARWLDSGVRAGSDPGRYLTDHRKAGPEPTV
jgi:hypothetical protein